MELPEENLALCKMVDVTVRPHLDHHLIPSWRLSTSDDRLWVVMNTLSLKIWQHSISELLRWHAAHPHTTGQLI